MCPKSNMYKIQKYHLIDWGSPAIEYRTDGLSTKEVYMTEEEAQIKNNDLVKTKTTLRYVRANNRELNKKTYKVK